MSDAKDPDPAGHAEWFRPPTRREHVIAAWLFIGFGFFFLAMFYLCYGWGFRWVILVLGIYSIWHGLRHAIDAKHTKPS